MNRSIVFLLLHFAAFGALSATRTSTTSGGNWSSASTWVGGNIPTSADDVVINGNVIIDGNYTIKTLTINSGKTLTSQANNARKLTLSNTSWGTVLTNNGTFNATDGTVEFTASSNAHGITGIVVFNNVILNGVSQMNFGSSSTINGTIRLNTASFITTHPTYGSNATMEINGSYTNLTNYYLWGNTVATTPPNISVISGTTNIQQAIIISKSLTVASGATLDLAKSCVTLKTTFTSITNHGTLNLGSVLVESGLTWNINQNFTLSNLTVSNNAVVNAGSYTLTLIYNTTGYCSGSQAKIINLVGTGQFNAGTGTLVVNTSANGNAAFGGNITLNNLVAAGGTITTNNGNTLTINGNVTVNTGANFQYGNTVTTGSVVYGSNATVTNNGGNTSNITNPTTVPTAPTPVTVDNGLTALSNSTTGGGSFNTPLKLTAPNNYSLTSNMTLTGSRKVLYIYAPAEFITNGFSLTADSVYLMGKLTITNPGGLSDFLGSTKIVMANGSTVSYVANNGTQTITAASYSNLILSGVAAKNFSGAYTIGGNFTVSGTTPTLLANPSFTFNGGDQTVAGLPYHAPTFSGTGNKTLTDTTKVTGVVSILGSANLISNGLLTLTSTPSGTASIGPLTGSANITGDVNYERYIPAGRMWRFLGWPVSGNTFANTWQNHIYITGSGTGGGVLGSINSNGFDWTATNEASIYYYNESSAGSMNNKWTSIPNTSAGIDPTKGYRVFIRGSREQGSILLNGSTYTPQAVTLKGKGLPNKGTINVSLTCSNGCGSGDGWNFVANPYPSAINWNDASWVSSRSSSISGTVHVYNPSSNNYSSWSPTGGSVNGGSNIIASGQAFWIKTNGNATLSFNESYKASNTSGGFFGKVEEEVSNNLKIQIGDSLKVFDEAVVYMYPNATNYIDADLDALKPNTANATISTYTKETNDKLVFNAIAELSKGAMDTILLHTPMSNANYQYTLNFLGLTSFTDVTTQFILLDAYTGGIIVINPIGSYRFSTIKNNAATYAANRFSLVITTGESSTLPVSLSSFYGKKVSQSTVLNWTTASESMNERFDIQRSNDGLNFETIGSVKGAINSNTLIRYSFTDNVPSKGINYYRLKQVNTDASYSYSAIVSINFNSNPTLSKAKVFPIPATNELTLELNNTNPTLVEIRILNVFGQEVSIMTVDADMDHYVVPIDISNYKTGIYFLELRHPNESIESIKFIKTN